MRQGCHPANHLCHLYMPVQMGAVNISGDHGVIPLFDGKWENLENGDKINCTQCSVVNILSCESTLPHPSYNEFRIGT